MQGREKQRARVVDAGVDVEHEPDAGALGRGLVWAHVLLRWGRRARTTPGKVRRGSFAAVRGSCVGAVTRVSTTGLAALLDRRVAAALR
ncbi:hypothetical protein GCM10027596_09680 [Nocardioides korecus]